MGSRHDAHRRASCGARGRRAYRPSHAGTGHASPRRAIAPGHRVRPGTRLTHVSPTYRESLMSVTAPLGFRAAGVAAGLKESGARDVAVVINDGPSRAAVGVFTANRVKAAPVLWTQQVVSGGRVRAVLLNSGGANACTGPAGFQDTHASAERLAAVLADSPGEIAVC